MRRGSSLFCFGLSMGPGPGALVIADLGTLVALWTEACGSGEHADSMCKMGASRVWIERRLVTESEALSQPGLECRKAHPALEGSEVEARCTQHGILFPFGPESHNSRLVPDCPRVWA